MISTVATEPDRRGRARSPRPGPTADAIARRVEAVHQRIADAALRSGRSGERITLVAVSKGQALEVVRAAVAAGLRDLGENRVQELLPKIDAVAGEVVGASAPSIRWHLVGRLQRNKARDVVGRVAQIHSVDRPALADELSRRARAAGVVQPVLVQVNVAGERAKGGCPPEQALRLVEYARGLEGLAVEGLMTIPPLPPPGIAAGEAARAHFARLRELRDRARAEWSEVAHLSMGMSADFDAAVEEGATIVRVGTTLFGPRNQRPTTSAVEPGLSREEEG